MILTKLSYLNKRNYLKNFKFIKKQNLYYFKTAEEICKSVFSLEKSGNLKILLYYLIMIFAKKH